LTKQANIAKNDAYDRHSNNIWQNTVAEKKTMADDGTKRLTDVEQETRKVLIKLSASRAKTFEQCPRKYYYSYLEHLPQKEWDHLELGTYVHAALEIFHRAIMNGSKEPLRKLMGMAASEAFKRMTGRGRSLPDEQLREVKAMLSDYLARLEEKGVPNVLEVEFPFTISLNDLYDLTGVIDRIDRDQDGLLHIVDYKTSKNSKYMEPFQLNTYGLLLESRFPGIERFRASYIMLKLGCQPLSYEFTTEDIAKCRAKLVRCAQKITSEERWVAKPSRLCDWCDFKDVCFNSW
jgi:putative RecB family exonuclease